jgi:SNF2 family DNA or RNA helicase
MKGPDSDVGYLSGILAKAMSYADTDPEASLMHARKSAQAICTAVFAKEVGDPGNTRLDKLIELLAQKDKVPERIKIPLRVIQQYGNYAAHFQTDQRPIDRAYVDPCLSALIHVSTWYFREYLGMDVPAIVAEANNEYEPQPPPTPKVEIAVEGHQALAAELQLPSPLRQYQWEGVSFLARNDAALLADEMGLGKTIQTIVALRILFRGSVSRRALIIAPNALAYNWQREFTTWAPDMGVRRVMGTAKDRLATYQLPVQVLIATYEQIRSDALDMDADMTFDAIVLDEAQRVKNRHSRSALACRLLRRSRAWVLTGTPLENSVEDLVSIFVFLSPGLVDSGMPPVEVHRRIQPHFLRRRKKDVLSEIPPIIMQDMMLELTGTQEAAYTDLWLARRAQAKENGVPVSDGTLFALITKLKQLCNYEPDSEESVKLDALSVLLEDCSEPEDKVIVFSQYVETLNFVSRHLGSFPHDIYTGEQSQDEKDQVLAKFKRESGPRALLMSLRAGGVGLNIQEASTVVLFDRWWNPAVEDQAIQRAHRFGRSRPLHVIRFLVADTIEERINAILKEKRVDFERYVENAENAPVRLFTREELRKILELSRGDTDE